MPLHCQLSLILSLFFFSLGYFLPQRALAAGAGAAAVAPAVYLTFDADMTPHMKRELEQGQVKQWYDPGLIAYLEKERIPATIFVTGMFAEIYSDAVKSWADSGLFAFGNHSYSHPGFTAHCYRLATATSDADKRYQIERAQQILTPLIGYSPAYFRYPGLCHTASDDKLVTALGLKLAPVTIVSGDAFARDSAKIVRWILKQIKNDAVILMHTGGPHAPATTAAVKVLVPVLKKKGFVFKILP